MNVQELEYIFSIYPWTPDAIKRGFIPLLSPDVAKERARVLYEDLARLPFAWDIKEGFPTRDFRLPTYEIPGTNFGEDAGSGVADVRKAHGVGLNWGNPLKLAKVCSIARQHFGSDWMLKKRFKEKLLNGNHHLSFVEEFLWLGMWHSVTGVEDGQPPEYEATPFAKDGFIKQIDWRFRSCGQVINLEVKYRPKDWMRHVDGSEFYLVRDDYYEDCEGKFPVRYDGELNLVGVSSPAWVDRSWQLQTETFIRTHTAVNGIILWAQDSQTSGVVFDVQSKEKSLIDLLFTATQEDKGYVAIVMHIWKERDARGESRGENIARLMEEMSERNYQAFLDSVCGKDRQSRAQTMPEEPATEAQPEAPAPAPRRRARIKVADVKIDRPYGELQRFSTQPTPEQIAKAIEEGRLDERINAGEHQLAMYEDCNAAGKGDLGEIMRLIQEYHAQRIAYFVFNGWDEENDRLTLDHQGNLRDGGHRYWAAAYLGKEEVFVEYQPAPERPPAVQG